MVLVLGVSAGSSGARAILAHSDQPHQHPIDQCVVARRPGASVGEPVAAVIDAMHSAAAERGELITAIAVTYRCDMHAESIKSSVPIPGATPTRLVKESTAQMRYLRFTGRLPKAGTVVLYDLGSSGLTLTLADCVSGTPIRTRRSTVLGGDEYDAQIHHHLAHVGIASDVATCRQHKEALSSDRIITAADPVTGNRMVLTRSDIAYLQSAGIHDSASFVRHLLEESGDTPEAVVLLGGCTRNPLVEEWLNSTLDLPTISEADPEVVSARGAVALAGDRPARVIRVARAIGASAPPGTAVSRRKIFAAVAVTGVLAATIAGLMLGNRSTDEPAHNDVSPSPMEVAGIPKTPFP
ncbi:Hsp70 family protein [Antrihabitans stalactiti]|uniref:Hsp70 protein n=1 Tax=Antrihabitans stalactiti TaxID=2584121 RepID=A0A848KTJ6_9NOCA|nr:Hsp70 family protein [Antrihabitans stalactiti]NMN98877.1 hypothetical protein [Antrihabitans stalactiti]